MSHRNGRVPMIAVVMATVVLLVAGVGAHEYASAQGEPPDPFPAAEVQSTAQTAFVADPSTAGAVSDSRLMVIENTGQWPQAARFQVWGGPAGTMWLAEDAIWIAVMEEGRGEATRTANSPRDAVSPGLPRPYATDLPGLPRPYGSERSGPTRSTNIKIAFPGANANPQIVPVERLDTKVSYFLGNDPAQWHAEVPVWGGVRYIDLYPGVDLVVGAAGEGEESGLWALQARDGADTTVVKMSTEGAEGAEVTGGDLQMAAAGHSIKLPLPGADFTYPVNESLVDGGAAAPIASDGLSAQAAPPSGNPADLLFSTYLGGNAVFGDEGDAIAVDRSGRAYVTGLTWSNDFPTTPGAFDRRYGADSDDPDAFAVRLNPTGSTLEYATFLGGGDGDAGYGIAVDPSGRAYVTGWTESHNFPTTPGVLDRSYNGGGDAFVVRLNASGSSLDYATFLGGPSGDSSGDIAVDASGQAYVTGVAGSSDFPTTLGAFDRRYSGGQGYNGMIPGDAFVARLNAAGTELVYGTFLGGRGADYGAAIALDATGRAYVAGGTNSSDFPATPGAFDTTFNGQCLPLDSQSETCISLLDAFVVRLNPAGSTLEYATYLGGSDDEDMGTDIAVDASGRVYVTGRTDSGDFPTTPGAFDRSFNGYSGTVTGDAFVTRLKAGGNALDYSTFLGGSGWFFGNWAKGVAVDAYGRAYVTGWTDSYDFPITSDAVDAVLDGCTLDMDGDYLACGDAFVMRLNASGTALEYATYLGGSLDSVGGYGRTEDYGSGIALDDSGHVYITGRTSCSDFPTTPGAFDRSNNGHDGFVAKLALGTVNVKTRSFQNNVAPYASYAGESDTIVAEAAPTSSYGNAPSLIVSGSHPAGTGLDNWALLKWNLRSITGLVQAATLTLNVTDPSGQRYELYEATGPWTDTAVTWNSKPPRAAAVLGVVQAPNAGPMVVTLNSAGLDVVQRWLTGPSRNYGLYVMDSANTNTLIFDSSEQVTPTLRPKLTITYRPPILTRQPWVENVTATSANVLWEADFSCEGNLNYRVRGAGAWTPMKAAATLVSGRWQAKAGLTGLTANTTYEYRVRASADSAWTAIATFKTAAAVTGAGAGTGAATGGNNATTIFMPLMRR